MNRIQKILIWLLSWVVLFVGISAGFWGITAGAFVLTLGILLICTSIGMNVLLVLDMTKPA